MYLCSEHEKQSRIIQHGWTYETMEFGGHNHLFAICWPWQHTDFLRTKSLMWIFLFNSKNHSNYKLLLVISNCPKCHLPPSVIMMSKRLVIFSSLSNVCIVLFPSRLATIRFEVHRCIIHLSRSLALFISLRGRSVSRTVPCGVDV